MCDSLSRDASVRKLFGTKTVPRLDVTHLPPSTGTLRMTGAQSSPEQHLIGYQE
jgi:hypothetical protein